MDKVIKQVSDFLYPRPTSICDQCCQSIILCWGSKIKPYWRHAKGNNHAPINESETHKLAKNLLLQYLNNGNKFQYRNINENIVMDLPNNVTTYDKEINYKNSRWDIAGFDNKSEIKMGIEILHKHKTFNVKDRNDLPWIELKATDVIEKIIEFNEGAIKNISFIDYSDKNKLCNIDDYATRLAYLILNSELDWECESVNIVKLANFGKYKIYKEYQIPKYTNWTSNLWNDLIKIGKCIKCKEQHDIQCGKPYCYDCYKNIDDYEDVIDINIKSDKLQITRQKLSFLNKIEGGWKVGDKCSWCQNNYDEFDEQYQYLWGSSNYVSSYVYWMREKKKLCVKCLDERIQILGISINDLI